ncbi:DUF1015 family protein [Actinobacteria bacterium YIM 96077]|uniref:DUF1015 domain-containing protein n=1 Tax=Phytoactinopolyspora halophila TaxID=1981511 RepID=A0A329R033_9ACTN|nr:DUF1015 family protein [Phytoactinopolyspora halophila]AYY11571.1 DUF1015 family protein [Actinobacteria bacterium YIM 96077]RAW17945.1 DUF1015 domain-containing protein [Phytoactinopolyspora halophila]
MTIVHAIENAWLTTGGTGAQNYDEFADDAEVTAIIEANPKSALAIEMPHRAPDTVGTAFADALPDAVERLLRAKTDGDYAPADDIVVLYRITDPSGGKPAYGMFCLVNTDQISTSEEEPGLVIRNEDVFIEKVRERVALAETTGHLLSPVLLMQTRRGEELEAELAAACADAGEPAATDVDHAGRTHAIWPLPAGPTASRLCELAGGGELLVADGNHRTLAAQNGGLARFLAVISTPQSLTIQPYHRLVRELAMSSEELVDRLRHAGAEVTPLQEAPDTPATAGTVHLYAAGSGYAVTLPTPSDATVTERLDHARVERVVLADALGLDAGDKRIIYVGGDYPADWLRGEVDAGRADLAILIPPVPMQDFVEVNLARQKMPRKSTWFTPKARAGLVLVQLRPDA